MDEKIISILSKAEEDKRIVCIPDLQRLLSYLGYTVSQVEIRQRIGDMCRNEVAMIGSCDKGFFMIRSEEDLKMAIGYILSRIDPMVKRTKGLEKMWRDRNGDIQGTLF